MQNYPSYSIKQRIAQLIFPRLNVNEWAERKEYYIKLAEMGVGGFCVFFGNMNEMRTIVKELSEHSDIPLLYCCDMEHGMGMRFDDAAVFPRAGAIGAANNPGNAYIVSKITAIEAKSCGIFWNLAPVADINSNQDNPIINIRAYSDNAIKASQFANAYIDAANSERMVSCVKHFPGHGDTAVDSHIIVPVINKTMEELTNNELVPFYAAIKNNVPSIMVGHLAVPAIDNSMMPATLSEEIISGFLRNKLKYDGIVITDALEMHSVERLYPKGEATYLALKAGADVLLMPGDPELAYKYIIDNLDTLNKAQIEQSFERIINRKRWCGLLDGILDKLPDAGSLEDNGRIALKMAKSTIRILPQDKKSEVEIEEDDAYFLVSVLTDDRDLEKAVKFAYLLQSKTVNNCDSIFINNELDLDTKKLLKQTAQKNNVLIIAVYQSPSSYSSKKIISEELKEILNDLSRFQKTVLVNFAPEAAANNLNYSVKIDTFSDDAGSMNAVAEIISGKEEKFDFVSDINEAYIQKEKLESENLNKN